MFSYKKGSETFHKIHKKISVIATLSSKIADLSLQRCYKFAINSPINLLHIFRTHFLNPIQDGRSKKTSPPYQLFPVISTNAEISPQNLLTFSFNTLATLVRSSVEEKGSETFHKIHKKISVIASLSSKIADLSLQRC